MKINTIGLIVVLAASFCTATATLSSAEYRFGPWVYWAPYYYPTPAEMQCLGFKSDDFAPRYQSPNPLAPPDCPPPPVTSKRLVSKQTVRRQLNGPVIDTPSRAPVRPGPAYGHPGSRPAVIGGQSLDTAPSPPRHGKRFRFGSGQPQPVGSAPGSQRVRRPSAIEPPR